MAVAVIVRYPNLSPTIYDDAIASLDLDANPPAGAVLHVAAEAEDGLVVTEIWRTEQTFQAFYDYRLVPALRAHGMESTAPGRGGAAPQSVRGRDGHGRADGRRLPAGDLRGCGALGAPHQSATPRRYAVDAATSDARAMRGGGASPVPLVAFASSVPNDPSNGVERGGDGLVMGSCLDTNESEAKELHWWGHLVREIQGVCHRNRLGRRR